MDDFILLLKELAEDNISEPITIENLPNILIDLCNYWFENNANIASSKFSTNTWYSYEYKIWELGEALRKLLKKKKYLVKDEFLQISINEIIDQKKYGKGRQSFSLLPGEFKFFSSINVLVKNINDEDIQGQVLNSLTKLKVKGLDNEISLIYSKNKGWVKKEAKKYLSKSDSW